MRSSFIILFLLMYGFSAMAQVVYSTVSPCVESSLHPEFELITTLGDDLFYEDEIDSEKVFYRVIAADNFRTEVLLTGNTSVWDIHEDYFLLTKEDSLFLISIANEVAELITVGPDNIRSALLWNGDYYFLTESTVPGAPFNSDDIVKYDPIAEETTILYTGDFGGFRGLGATDNFVIAIGNDPQGKGLVRTDGTVAGSTYYHTLFPGGNEFFPDRAVFPTRVGDRLFFFYGIGGGADAELNIFFVTDGTSAGTLPLASFNRLGFDEPPAPVVVDDRIYFIQTRLGAPTGITESLFSSDGTVAGTLNLDPTPDGSYLSPDGMAVLNGQVYFDGAFGLYRTINNGTSSEQILDDVFEVATFNDSLAIRYSPTFGDSEPYIVAGTGENPRLLANLGAGDDGSNPSQFTAGDSVLYFVPNTFGVPRQVFVYDLRRNLDPFGIIIDTITVTDVTDAGLGSITVSAPMGAQYSYALNDSEFGAASFFADLMPGDYTVFIQNELTGCVDSSEVTVDNLSAISDWSRSNEYRLYPNPIPLGRATSSGIAYSGSDVDPLQSFELFDLTGRRIATGYSLDQIFAELLTSGQYLLLGYNGSHVPLFRQLVVVQ